MTGFADGVRSLGAGFGIIVRSPRLLLLGALPALISTMLLLAGVGALLYFSSDLVTWMTPFADRWADAWRQTLRVVLGATLVGAGALVASVSFIALTLLIGGPFYEHIAEKAEENLGIDSSGDGAGVVRSLGRGLRDSLATLVIAMVGGTSLFVLGFTPVIGQTVIPVLGVLFAAWMISLEMVGVVFARRGLTVGDRHRAMRRNRAAVLGFGLPTYVLCLVPVAQLVVIPAAVVGGTLLAHRILGSGAGVPLGSGAGVRPDSRREDDNPRGGIEFRV